ncbi:MAG: helix-turn-helix transcriptional regulator [Hyphomicrobiaceae bacterium]
MIPKKKKDTRLSLTTRDIYGGPVFDSRAQLCAFRKHHSITQEQLAERWGVSTKTIVRWEAGQGLPQPWMQREVAATIPPPPDAAILAFVQSSPEHLMLFDEKHRFVLLSQSIAFTLRVGQTELAGIRMERFAPEPYIQGQIDEARSEGGLDAFFSRPVHINAAPSLAPGNRTVDGVSRSLYSIAHRVCGSNGQPFRLTRLIEGPASDFAESKPTVTYL